MVGAIIALGLVVLLAIGVFKLVSGRNALVDSFKRCNVIVFGKKGTGKDLVFNKVINARKQQCYTNIPYSAKYCHLAEVRDFTVEPNTYKDFLNGTLKTVEKTRSERMDFYISDGGIVLPSQYHGELDKRYPSLPIFYALSRHLTNSNIHINTQNLSRVWDKLREQADCYVRVERTVKVFGLLFTTFTLYDYYESAKQCLQPYPHGIFDSAFNTASFNEYVAMHGNIKRHIIVQRVKDVYYDTRYFHKVLYGVSAPSNHK